MVEPRSKQAQVSRAAEEIGARPRLVLRFALYTGAVLLAAGLAILWVVNREVAQRAEQTMETHARIVAEESLRSHLRASDFVAPVATARRAALDDLFRRRILIPGVVGARLVSRDGTITYAAFHPIIGTRVAYKDQLADVFGGASRRRVTRTVSWRGERNVKVLQALLPVRSAHSTSAVGALELDQDYAAVDISIGNARHRLILILAFALLALYASLFPILRRVTSQLEAHNRHLHDHAEERGRLLDGERAARAEAETVQRLLAEQNERLRELDRLKDDFVSLVSHELRTPLTSIRGYLELLLAEGGETLTKDQRRFLGIVDRNSERLLALVSDLLFLAQVEAGKLALQLGTVDLNEIVEDCVEAASPHAAAHGIELVVSSEPIPCLEGDRSRLAQVLDNLVSNALKFTPGGGRVEVRLTAADGFALLEVEDTGLGIPPEEQQRLFERFFRSSRATENAIPGTGLGLTITKAIVERHGGRIVLESTEDAGTTVQVQLPLGAEQKRKVEARELTV